MTSLASPQAPAALPRVIGTFGLAAAIFNITVGAAIFVLPAHVAGPLGAAAPLAYLVCAVATALVALCIAEAGSRVPRSGGPYAYVETALGPFAGFLCGVLLWVGFTLGMAAVGTVFADALGGLIPSLAGTMPRLVILVVVFAALAVVNVRGASLGSRVSGVSSIAKLVPLIAFVALGLPHVDSANLAIGSLPPLSALGNSGLLLMFAFFGMESALQVSGEVKQPARTVPRAIGIAVTAVGLLYIAVQLVAQGVLGSALASPETARAPLAAAAERFAGAPGALLILIGMVISTFGFETAGMLSAPRTLFAFATDGYLPRAVARVHSVFRTPHVAVVVQAVVAAGLALSGTYVMLAKISNVAILLVYLACCIGAWRLRRLDARTEGEPFLMPVGAVVPWVAAALIGALLWNAKWEEWLPTLGVVGLALVAYLLRRAPLRQS
jgi:APA family basic amino acid/polyamine antiporter